MTIDEITEFLQSTKLRELLSDFETIRIDHSCSVTIETLPALAFISVLMMIWFKFRGTAQRGSFQGSSETRTNSGPEFERPAEEPVQVDEEASECEDHDCDGPIIRCDCLDK